MSKSKTFLTGIHTKNELNECPIILQFQNGTLNKNCLEPKSLTCVYNNDKNQKEVLFAVNNSIYQGVVREEDELTVNYIAIRNKVTNKMRFIQVDTSLLSNQILIEKASAPSVQHYDEGLAKKLLLKNFGGKRASRHLQRDERMKVNLDTIKAQLETAIEDTPEVDENDTAKANASNLNECSVKDIVPPFNKEAKKVDDIYNLTDIIPENLLERLNEEANEILVTKEIIPISSEYLLNQINEIRKSPSSDSLENITKIKIYLYMDGLVNLLKSRSRNMSKVNLSNISEKVENDIRTRFSPKNSSIAIRTVFSSDKALCYYITLALLTSPKYKIDINILIKELSKPKRKIVQYAQFVHAKLMSTSNVLALKLPVAMTPARMFFKRK